MGMSDARTKKGPVDAFRPARVSHEIPWQIWVTVCLLGLEGVGNLFAIPTEPRSVYLLAAKVLFITGLLRAWRWVFALFLVDASLHILAFSFQAPFVAFLNLVVVLLVGSTLRYYFPYQYQNLKVDYAKSPSTGLFDREFDG